MLAACTAVVYRRGRWRPAGIGKNREEMLMIRLSVGDQVTIRFGKQQGLKGKIIKSPQADVYKVKVDDGSIRYYSGKGLEREQVQQTV